MDGLTFFNNTLKTMNNVVILEMQKKPVNMSYT